MTPRDPLALPELAMSLALSCASTTVNRSGDAEGGAGSTRVDVNLYIASGGDLETPAVVTLLANALLYPSVL